MSNWHRNSARAQRRPLRRIETFRPGGKLACRHSADPGGPREHGAARRRVRNAGQDPIREQVHSRLSRLCEEDGAYLNLAHFRYQLEQFDTVLDIETMMIGQEASDAED
jgi:hypothetical protein